MTFNESNGTEFPLLKQKEGEESICHETEEYVIQELIRMCFKGLPMAKYKAESTHPSPYQSN